MGGLPRPDVPPGPRRELVDALHDLHHRAGWPSLRTLAREAGCSHTTVSAVFSSPRLPAWGTLELVVEALHGDADAFRDQWLAASAPAAGPSSVADARIAGRRAELAAVRRHLETGTGLLLVTGEAGIGKTRLVQTAAGGTDAFVATSRCLPLSTEVPLMPVVDVLRTVHAGDDGLWLEEALAGTPAYVRDSLARLLPELGGPAPVATDDEFARQHLFAAVARVLVQLHGRRALGLVLEDLHWADAATLDVLEHLLSGAPGLPLVGTWRLHDPTVSAAHSAWFTRMARLPGTDCVDLAPLTRAETAEQLSLLTHGSIDADRARRIHDRSRGHPLFTEQLAAQSEDDRRLPHLLAEVLDRSLDGLGRAAGAVATTLGVADRGLPDAVLHQATGLEPGELVSALHELHDRYLLAVDGAGHAELRHPLLADAARRRLVPCESAEEHRRLAVALAARPEADPAEIAEHWRHAGDPREELRWRMVAARQAHVRTAPRAESTHLLRALEISRAGTTGTDGFDEVTARLDAFDALELAGRLEEAARVIGAALAGVDDLDDRTAAEVLRRAAMSEGLLVQDSRAALVLVDRAIDRLEPHGPTQCLVHSLDLRANQLIDLGRYNEALDSLDRAVDVCIALDDTELFFGTSATLAWHLAHLGDLEEALRRVREAHARLQGTTDPRREAYMAMMHTDALIQHHRPADEVARAAQRALDIGVEQDLDFHVLTLVRTNVAEALINTGLVRRAAQVLADIPVSSGYDHWPVRWACALVDIADGRLDHALDQLAAMSGGSVPQPLLEKARWSAVIHLWKGQPDRAWTGLVPAIETELDSLTVMDAGPAFATAARAAADLATLEARQHEPGSLTRTLAELRERAAVDPLGPAPAPVSRRATTTTWDAELARAARTDTVGQWTRAATEWDRLRSPHDAGYCRWRAAQVALREGQGTGAARLLRRAASDAREHVPLGVAVAETAATLRGREHRG